MEQEGNMTDYFSRDAAINAVYEAYADGESAYDALEKLPAADVRENKRGRWMTGNDNPRTFGRIRAMCGRCGAFALAEMVNAGSYKEQLSNFCPNCGADMREDDDAS